MTVELDRGIAALRKEFASEIAAGIITHLGTYSCRRKNHKPGAPWSEHAWTDGHEQKKGNAVDVMFRNYSYRDPVVKEVGDRVAAWMRTNPGLWSEVFWQIALHYNHVHGTATPRRNFDNKQVPPCVEGGGDDDTVEKFVSAEQENLNAAGFTDKDGNKLSVDGVLGPKTQSAMLKRDKAAASGGGGQVQGTFVGTIK